MKKVAVISYYWPPAGGPGVQRWLKFTSYLKDYGIDPVVIIPENPYYPVRDASLVEEVPEGITVIKVGGKEPYGIAAKIAGRETKTLSKGIIEKKSPSLIQKLFLYIRGNFFIPDARVGWVKPVVKRMDQLLRELQIDTVITTGPPHSVHLIGKLLKEKHPIHWIADFRDPWTTISYHKDLKLGGRARRKHLEMEEDVLNSADSLIVTSFSTEKEFSNKTAVPISVITNGFDVEIADGKNLDEAFTISHVGSLLSERNPILLWQALHELKEENVDFGSDLQIHLVGNISTDVLKSLKELGLEVNLQLSDYVPHEEAIARQRKSQLLLLVESDTPETKAIIPGKLFEYLASKRPILAIGPEGWDAAKIIADHQAGKAFNYGDLAGLKEQLQSWYSSYRNNNLVCRSINIEQFSRKKLTRKLSQIILQE